MQVWQSLPFKLDYMLYLLLLQWYSKILFLPLCQPLCFSLCVFLTFEKDLFETERERETVHVCAHEWREGQRENLQADSVLSSDPEAGLDPRTPRSKADAEPKADAQKTEPPRRPWTCFYHIHEVFSCYFFNISILGSFYL